MTVLHHPGRVMPLSFTTDEGQDLELGFISCLPQVFFCAELEGAWGGTELGKHPGKAQ